MQQVSVGLPFFDVPYRRTPRMLSTERHAHKPGAGTVIHHDR